MSEEAAFPKTGRTTRSEGRGPKTASSLVSAVRCGMIVSGMKNGMRFQCVFPEGHEGRHEIHFDDPLIGRT